MKKILLIAFVAILSLAQTAQAQFDYYGNAIDSTYNTAGSITVALTPQFPLLYSIANVDIEFFTGDQHSFVLSPRLILGEYSRTNPTSIDIDEEDITDGSGFEIAAFYRYYAYREVTLHNFFLEPGIAYMNANFDYEVSGEIINNSGQLTFSEFDRTAQLSRITAFMSVGDRIMYKKFFAEGYVGLGVKIPTLTYDDKGNTVNAPEEDESDDFTNSFFVKEGVFLPLGFKIGMYIR